MAAVAVPGAAVATHPSVAAGAHRPSRPLADPQEVDPVGVADSVAAAATRLPAARAAGVATWAPRVVVVAWS